MASYIVKGSRPLSGTIVPAGNKNAALPVLAAALLTEEEVVLENIPRIRDVDTLLELIRSVGAEAWRHADGTVRIRAKDLGDGSVDPHLSSRIRASILLAGPMLARVGRISLPPPGGDIIGRRRVDTHFLALTGLGARIEVGSGYDIVVEGRLRGAELFLDEPSVTATENTVMAAVLAQGNTLLENSASEPHVQDLCRLLNAMGAHISGIGTHILHIEGVERLHGARFRIQPDHIEVGSFIGLAAATRSALTIEGAGPRNLRSTLIGFDRLGVKVEIHGEDLFVPAHQERRVHTDVGGHIPKIDDGPWPAFPADLTSIALVLATQCEGTILIHEKMFESRMYFSDKLIAMGARIVLCDPHRAIVVGPSPLTASRMESPDIRAGMALLIAALAAEGTSQIGNIGQIERGYENIHARLGALGAEIERVE